MRWITTLLARLTSYFLYRRLEVEGRPELGPHQPVLIVANHLNGLIDPVLLVTALGHTPRFLAKATLGNLLGVGWLLRACGVIFVQRQADGAGTASNANAFTASHDALRSGDVVVIFPEGTTHDRPRLEPVRTGAARIALGARAAGADGLIILPVGLAFADKVSLRGDALVQFGQPMRLDDVAPPAADDTDQAVVRDLTGRIEQALRDVSPDFPDVETWLALNQAAEVETRRPDRPRPTLAVRAQTARRLARTGPAARAEVMRQIGRYATVLAGLRIDDRDVITPVNLRQIASRAIRTSLLVVLLGSLVGATLLINAIPVALVALASLGVRRPVLKGTVRALVGLVAFPATWFTAATLSVDGWASVLLLVIGLAVGAVSAIALLDRVAQLAGALLRWRLVRERVATLADAAALRREVVDAVRSALRTVPTRLADQTGDPAG